MRPLLELAPSAVEGGGDGSPRIRSTSSSTTVRMPATTTASARPAASVAGSRASSSRSRAPATATPAGEGLRKTMRGALITNSLPALQNLIKRSPESYAEEFSVQWARFGSLVKIVQLGLGGAKGDEEQLKEVTGFVCQVRGSLLPAAGTRSRR